MTGCRDGVPPFVPLQHDFDAQLTFGLGNDIAPVWTPDGEHIIYDTNHYDPLPCTLGVLLAIPSDGGTALPALELAQRALRRPLAFPAISANGERIAYFDRFVLSQDCVRRTVVSNAATLRVRTIGSATSPLSDPSLLVEFNGAITPPTWSSDNQRIAFSDGAQLYVWSVGAAATQPIPGGEGGEWPAWEPHGERIAFTAGGSIVVMRTDGTQRVLLGAGTEPSWSPDGQFIYARRNNMIVRITVQTGASQVVPDTNFARTPSVSPDGTRLAFARAKPQLEIDYDIWVVALSP